MNINELNFDNKNANKHTQKGLRLLEKSLSKLGAGRSILIDKDNNIIAGNGVVEVAGQIGLDKIKVIETDGTELIAVKRKDVSINSKKGRELAIADNQTAKTSIDFDMDVLNEISDEFALDLGDWELDMGKAFNMPSPAPSVNTIPADEFLPSELEKYVGDDIRPTERIIIIYRKEQLEQLQKRLGITVNKVIYNLDELL
jgi:hypothetical protein